MQELIPLALGGIVGLIVGFIRPTGLKIGLFVVLCLALGVLVSYMVGELEVWWGFFTFDTLLVWIGAAIVATAVSLWRRRAVTPRA